MFGPGTGRQTTAAITTTAETTADPDTGQVSFPELVKQANRYFNQAQNAQRGGDWSEYGRSLQLLEETLKQLEGNVE